MSKRKTTKEFIKDARSVHGDKYDYSNVLYETAAKKVRIRCIRHDWVFTQRANDHLSGKGCKKCGLEKRAGKKRISLKGNMVALGDLKARAGTGRAPATTKMSTILDRYHDRALRLAQAKYYQKQVG